MERIDNLSDEANQVSKLILDDGSIVQMTLRYRAAIQRWTMDIAHTDLTVYNINIGVSPNMLRDWREIISFGIGCTTTDGQDPIFLEDFTNGRATLHLLDAVNVVVVERDIYGSPNQV